MDREGVIVGNCFRERRGGSIRLLKALIQRLDDLLDRKSENVAKHGAHA